MVTSIFCLEKVNIQKPRTKNINNLCVKSYFKQFIACVYSEKCFVINIYIKYYAKHTENINERLINFEFPLDNIDCFVYILSRLLSVSAFTEKRVRSGN